MFGDTNPVQAYGHGLVNKLVRVHIGTGRTIDGVGVEVDLQQELSP
jgi:hypothetical protein